MSQQKIALSQHATAGSSMKSPRPVPKLLGVQYLRAIAALMVVYVHLQIQIPEYTSLLHSTHILDGGRFAAGVDIFFVISGFIMFVTGRDMAPGEFAARRIMRIVPLYWLLTLAVAALLVVAPRLFRATVLSSEYLLKSLLFIPYANPGQGGDWVPLLVPGWTLNLEMFFYAVFTLVLFLPSAYRLWATALIFVSLLIVESIASGGMHDSIGTFLANPRILEFWTGMLIGHSYVYHPPKFFRGASFAMIGIGFALLMVDYRSLPQSFTWLGDSVLSVLVPASAIVLGAVALERGGGGGVRYHPLPTLLGDASYSIYLTHIFSLGLARYLWSKLPAHRPDFAHAVGFSIFAMGIVLICAVIAYRVLEKPMLAFLQSFYRRTQLAVRATLAAR